MPPDRLLSGKAIQIQVSGLNALARMLGFRFAQPNLQDVAVVSGGNMRQRK